MSDLIVITFDEPFRAEEVRFDLLRMQKEYLIDIEDAVAARVTDQGKVKLAQIHQPVAGGAIGGGFWGMLIGLIFLNPFLGLAVGAGTGAVVGALRDVGIDDDFMKTLATDLQPGSSALFILARNVKVDRIIDELSPYQGRILRTSLSHNDEARLSEALGNPGGKNEG